MDLGREIAGARVPPGHVFVYWLGGAGFVLKSAETAIGIDLFLTDSCREASGAFKRIVPPPVAPRELSLDYLVASHDHGDHLDVGAAADFTMGKMTKVIGPGSVIAHCLALGVPSGQTMTLNRGDRISLLSGTDVAAVVSDHGASAPDAIGVVIRMAGLCVYFTGDTCYRPGFWREQGITGRIDLMLVPINGNAGNTDARDAAHFAREVGAVKAIPCHYWIFKEFGGNPGEFIRECAERAPNVQVEVPAIGERVVL